MKNDNLNQEINNTEPKSQLASSRRQSAVVTGS